MGGHRAVYREGEEEDDERTKVTNFFLIFSELKKK